MNDFFTYKNLEKLYLIEKFSLDEIAKKANCSKANIYYHMRKHDIKLRTKSQSRHLAILNNKFNYEKNYYDKKFFKRMSNSLAYVLGLIYSDGNLFNNRLSFAQNNFELVNKFKNLIGFTGRIKTAYNGNTLNKIHTITIFCDELRNDLLKYGITENKSLIIKFPNFNNIYYRHFIRGVFDGDGSVYLEKKIKKLRFSFVSGSFNFINSLILCIITEKTKYLSLTYALRPKNKAFNRKCRNNAKRISRRIGIIAGRNK